VTSVTGGVTLAMVMERCGRRKDQAKDCLSQCGRGGSGALAHWLAQRASRPASLLRPCCRPRAQALRRHR